MKTSTYLLFRGTTLAQMQSFAPREVALSDKKDRWSEKRNIGTGKVVYRTSLSGDKVMKSSWN